MHLQRVVDISPWPCGIQLRAFDWYVQDIVRKVENIRIHRTYQDIYIEMLYQISGILSLLNCAKNQIPGAFVTSVHFTLLRGDNWWVLIPRTRDLAPKAKVYTSLPPCSHHHALPRAGGGWHVRRGWHIMGVAYPWGVRLWSLYTWLIPGGWVAFMHSWGGGVKSKVFFIPKKM